MAKNRKGTAKQREFLYVFDSETQAVKQECESRAMNEKQNILSSSTFDDGEIAALKQKLISQLKENGC